MEMKGKKRMKNRYSVYRYIWTGGKKERRDGGKIGASNKRKSKN